MKWYNWMTNPSRIYDNFPTHKCHEVKHTNKGLLLLVTPKWFMLAVQVYHLRDNKKKIPDAQQSKGQR